ncbi:MAG: HlyD family secretion protein [Leptospirales bacterium]
MKNSNIMKAAFAGFVLVCLLAFFWWEHSRQYITTEDAVVAGRPYPITVRIPGTIETVLVRDNQSVQKGEPLFRLDDRDYKNRLIVDEAILSRSLELVKVDDSAIGEALAKESQIISDLKRAKRLKSGGFSTEQKMVHLTLARLAIEAHIKGLRSRVKADISNANRRRGQVEQDRLNLSYTTVLAPVTGMITAKSMSKGLYVNTGTPLGYVVPFRVWVIANLKESDLTYVRPGDDVTIRVDAYPGERFKGKVESIQQTTGAVMSLLPPENATGNFTKVVQRVPVRISLDPAADPNHFLRLGLSVTPTIHVDRSAPSLFRKPGQSSPHLSTAN